MVSQTERRVLHGETVPAAEKVASLFEPHTAVIARGKARRPTEFGLKVVLDEVEGGLVTRYAVAPGNPPDAVSWAASLDHHLACFGRPPDTATGDRGFFTPDNERQARRLGARQVALPQPGGRSAARQQQERQPGCRRAYRFRAGIEGRISVLKRGFGLDRCRYHGLAGAERWIGWGILAQNLRLISRALAARPAA